MKQNFAITIDLILTGAGTVPQIPAPANLCLGDAGFNPAVHLMVGQRAYNVDDKIWFYRSKTGIISGDLLTNAERLKLAGIEAQANKYVHPSSHSISMIDETEEEKVMTAAERLKLAGIEAQANKYVHPSSHSISMIDETEEEKVMTAAEREKLANLDLTNLITTAEREKLLLINVDSIISISEITWTTGEEKPEIQDIVSGELVEGYTHVVLSYSDGNIILLKNKVTSNIDLLSGYKYLCSTNDNKYYGYKPSDKTIKRLDQYGSIDNSFTTVTLGNYLFTRDNVAIQTSSNKLIIDDSNTIKRINLDGSTDNQFNPISVGAYIKKISCYNESIFFTSGATGLKKHDSSGNIDSSFPSLPNVNSSFVHLSDGKIIAEGYVNDTKKICCLNSDGSENLDFNASTINEASAYVGKLFLLPNDDLLVCLDDGSNIITIRKIDKYGNELWSFTPPDTLTTTVYVCPGPNNSFLLSAEDSYTKVLQVSIETGSLIQELTNFNPVGKIGVLTFGRIVFGGYHSYRDGIVNSDLSEIESGVDLGDPVMNILRATNPNYNNLIPAQNIYQTDEILRIKQLLE